MDYVGLPYVKHGRTAKGLDCYGLVKLFFKTEYDIELRDFDYYEANDMASHIKEQSTANEWKTVERSELRRGDVVLIRQFKSVSHIGVCVDSRFFVHCEDKLGSAKEKIEGTRWSSRIVACHRHWKLTDEKMGQVILHPSIVSSERTYSLSHSGEKISEIARRVLTEEQLETAMINVCGVVVPREYWCQSKIRAGAVITVTVVPEGGDNALLRTLLSIGVMALSGGIGGAFFGNMLQGGGAISALNMAIGTGISTMVGMMAVTALIPPPDESFDELTGTNESQVYSITGTGNRMDKFGIVPDVFGTYKYFPPYLAKPYVELRGSDQYLNCLFAISHGSPTIASEKIGDTLLSAFEDVTEETGVWPTLPTIIPSNISQVPFSIDLDYDTGWIQRSTEPDIEALSVDIVAPGGFTQFHDEGYPVEAAVAVQIQLAIYGSGVWWSPTTMGYVSAITVATYGTHTSGGYQDILFTGGDPVTPAVGRAYFGWVGLSSGPYTLQHIELQSNGQGYKSAPVATIPGSTGCSITLSYGNGTWVFRETSTDPLRWNIKLLERVVGLTGQYDIRQRRLTEEPTRTSTRDSLVWSGINNVYFDELININYPMTWKAIVIKATGSLNGLIDTYNAVLSKPSSNPADAFLQALQSTANRKPVATSRIDIAQINAWRIFCTTKGYIFNAVLDDAQPLESRLKSICSAGRATLVMPDNVYSVVIDQAQTGDVTSLTPRNSSSFTGTINYIRLPHALKCRFFNEDNDYQQESQVVYRAGYNAGNATIIETQDFFGVTTWAAVWSLAMYMLAVGEYQRESFTFDVDAEQLRCTKGDRVSVFHDTPNLALGTGRVVAIGANYLELDETMTLDVSTAYEMAIRKSDGTVVTVTLTAGQSGDVKQYGMVVPPGVTGDELCIVATSATGVLSAIITRIIGMADKGASITVVPYADAIYTSDSGTLPPYVAVGSITQNIPPPSYLDINEYLYAEGDLALQGTTVSWQHATEVIPDNYEVQILRPNTNGWQAAGYTKADNIRIPNTPYGTYSFRVRTKVGVLSSEWLYLTEEILTVAKNPCPDVTGLQASWRNDKLVLTWNPVSDIRNVEYVVRFGDTWDGGSTVSVQDYTEYFPGQNGTFQIKAQTLDKQAVSEAAATVVVDSLDLGLNPVKQITEDWTDEGTYFAADTEWVGGPRGNCYRPPVFLPLWWGKQLSGYIEDDTRWTVSGDYSSGPGVISFSSATYYFGHFLANFPARTINNPGTAVGAIDVMMSVNSSATSNQRFELRIFNEVIQCFSRNSNFEFIGSISVNVPNTGARIRFEVVNNRQLHTIELRANGVAVYTRTGYYNSTNSGTYQLDYYLTRYSGASGSIYEMAAGELLSLPNTGLDYITVLYNENGGEGVYQSPLANRFDLGYNGYIVPDVKSLVYHGSDQTSDLFSESDLLTMLDLFYGATSKITVQPQIRVAPSLGTPFPGTWSEWKNIVNTALYGRFFDIRLLVTVQDNMLAIIDEFSWELSLQTRTASKRNVTIPTFGTFVTYDTPFQTIPDLTYSQTGATSGDTVIVTAEGATGFTCQIVDGTGAFVGGVINYDAKGY